MRVYETLLRALTATSIGFHASFSLSPRPQDAVVEGSFGEEACRMQAHGARQLQAGKPRVHCSSRGGVEHVRGNGLTDGRTLARPVSVLFFDWVLH